MVVLPVKYAIVLAVSNSIAPAVAVVKLVPADNNIGATEAVPADADTDPPDKFVAVPAVAAFKLAT